MSTLCLSTNLTSSELAAWVQAIGTIIAVLAAAGIAIWQSHAQHRSALALHKTEQRHARAELAKSLLVLCRNCAKAAEHFTGQLSSRESIHNVATGATHFDSEELRALELATGSITLHNLPDSLIGSAMALAATVRQLRQTIQMALTEYRSMDASRFGEFFSTLNEMTQSLQLIAGDIEGSLKSINANA